MPLQHDGTNLLNGLLTPSSFRLCCTYDPQSGDTIASSLSSCLPFLGDLILLTSSPTGCLGRETKGEVVLLSRLRAALERLNPALPPEAITAAVDEFTRGLPRPRLLSGQLALRVQTGQS
jgi:hypothetical protein